MFDVYIAYCIFDYILEKEKMRQNWCQADCYLNISSKRFMHGEEPLFNH